MPPPDSVTVEVIFTLPSGAKCVRKERFLLPHCPWTTSERNGHATGDSTKTNKDSEIQTAIATALLVSPNPASGQVTISYDYGATGNIGRSLDIYDGIDHTFYVFQTIPLTIKLYLRRTTITIDSVV